MSINPVPLYRASSAPESAANVYTANRPVQVFTAIATNSTGSAIDLDVTVGGVPVYTGFSVASGTAPTVLGGLLRILESGESININASAANLGIHIEGREF